MQSQAARESGLGRATKEVRRREDDPRNVGDMAVDREEEAPVTFKDKLITIESQWEARVQHTPRLANMAADHMASVSAEEPVGLLVFDTPPGSVPTRIVHLAPHKESSQGLSHNRKEILKEMVNKTGQGNFKDARRSDDGKQQQQQHGVDRKSGVIRW
ncbi:hypothetical protein Goklo_019360 [Gossypium klotzschianum]|uniref:Uncharacterized protein n=1 Tax=Gossypium klotzschianum TaxID=34286 RepID=A0A7J8UNH6_9ROSI|nr:hypothetical protein [Gossypium klotzschianum]